MPGSPATPPARKLMPWEIIEDDPACNELATTPRQQRLEAECDTPTSVLSLDSAVEVPGFSPLRVDWTTGNLRKQTPVTPATHRSQKPALQRPIQMRILLKRTPNLNIIKKK
ncbi:uncharacterized protein [Choristoneura fumiferana]|uniref:uncharacterized protein n=1 Tax=Choristoneura fumiferana TaxID=7141 RepID=UPI003D1581E2